MKITLWKGETVNTERGEELIYSGFLNSTAVITMIQRYRINNNECPVIPIYLSKKGDRFYLTNHRYTVTNLLNDVMELEVEEITPHEVPNYEPVF